MGSVNEPLDGFEAAVDDETGSYLEELVATPVGRRWLLKAGLASAVALGVGSRASGSAQAAGRAPGHRRRMERTDLHFAFGHVRGVTGFFLLADGKRIALRRHTKRSREALRRKGGLWAKMDLSQLSHYVHGVELPAERAILISAHGKRGRREVVVGQLWRVPRASTIALAKASHRLTGTYRHAVGSTRRLKPLGLTVREIRSPQHLVQLEMIVDTSTTALALVSVHPNIATVNKTAAATTKAMVGPTPAVGSLDKYISTMQAGGRPYASMQPAKNADGTPAMITIKGQSTTFETFQLSSDSGLQQAVKGGVSAGVVVVRDTSSLGAVIGKPLEQDPAVTTQTWVQSQGIVPQTQPAASPGQLGAGLDITVKNPGSLFGTQTVVNGSFSNGQVPLKLYNNFVRWVWVYVQYLGANNENLSAAPAGVTAKWPDTQYSQSLGLLPQVFTVLGVPLWNTNSIDVNLNFPKDAHTARILFCGLGSNLLDGSWRDYFPAGAYPGKIAPQDEVLYASLITGILCIGITAFALFTDINIASTFAAIAKPAEGATLEVLQSLESVLNQLLPAGEMAALSVAAGAETYESINANGGSTENIWSILLPIASAIPKIIFNPATTSFWVDVAVALTAEETLADVVHAIPFIGEAIAVIEAVGDAVTLAEVCAETIVSPWVIENEVNLTYPATVTISIDPNQASSFPVTARSWQLTAKIDGGVALTPIIGQVNQGGHVQSAPIAQPVTAPFGGTNIQWSVVFLDQAGRQVGTGVSPQYPNSDPASPPSVVAITLEQIAVAIDSQTVFERSDTTGYSTAAGGYTWSSQISDSGTLGEKGIQQVTGTTVSTLAGVAGVVWEQGNKYYVRGVPTVENGQTISLGPATNNGYARRPFLLFDAFVGRGATGNNVLLEPDPTTAAYHVRAVSLDATTGAPTWDSSVSSGTFPLPVSAAALHSSGRVVVLNTDSGRLGTLLPANTPLPPLATYTAGPGQQVGLLSSPVAVAVTNPGVVLVLESAVSQISAFDLNGNPVPYFQPSLTRRSLVTAAGKRAGGPRASSPGQYTLALVSNGTYLDMAVDGSGQIYVLYYTGNGSATSNYHVDVYSPTGAVIDTNSPGVNVPHLAVDFWRSIYAANFDPLADTVTGTPHIDPALGVPEPSLSRFDPVEAVSLGAPTPRRHKPKHKHEPKHKHKHEHKHEPKHKHKHKHKSPAKHHT